MDRPFVYLNMAMTADGKITSAAREYPRFTSSADRLHMDRLRVRADAVLVGAGTLRADRPALHVRDDELRRRRVAEGLPETPAYVVVTRSGEIDLTEGPFADGRGGRRIVATLEGAAASRVEQQASGAEVWTFAGDDVDPAALLERLHREAGVERLLLEGGGELNWSFVAAGLVDELNLTVAPALLGGRDAPTWLEGGGFAMPDQARLRLEELRRHGDEIFLRYAVERPA